MLCLEKEKYYGKTLPLFFFFYIMLIFLQNISTFIIIKIQAFKLKTESPIVSLIELSIAQQNKIIKSNVKR